ncbi:MAG: translation initiation factor IF-3 [Dehalococcoidia bacterium]|nr:translation initiation factor IF-3 [Dehalococcoidia bacterium]
MQQQLRVNEKIRTKEVRVIADGGENLGVLPCFEALAIAKERGLDLVEVDPHADPPVCRLLDYGKWKYQQSKKEHDAHKHQKGLLLREVRMRPHIGEHDLERKLRLVERLLHEGDKVKVTIRFRGREMAHPETGHALLQRFCALLKDMAAVDRAANMQGRFLATILAPTNKKPPKVVKEAQEEQVGQT